MGFGAAVREYRHRLSLTQEELGARTGLSARAISRFEAGRVATPRASTVRLLADAFGLAGAERERFVGLAHPRAVRARRPAQLPPDVSPFVGRVEPRARLDALLAAATDRPTVVSGTAGVGKTALVVHWAHRVRDRFPDGQLYLNLCGYDAEPPMSTGDVLARFLGALGVPAADLPVETDERAARYRTEIADRRMLIVLDNASSVEQVRALLPGTPSSMVVTTSRDSLGGLVALDGAHGLELDLLPPDEARALMIELIGPRADAEPAVTRTLIDQCVRLPLALRVAAQLAVSRPTLTLADLVAELVDEHQRLDLLDPGDDPHAAVRTVFSWSVRHLPPEAARAFELLGLHPGPELDPYGVASLVDRDVDEARSVLATLTRGHLVHATGDDRFGVHDLLRAYAAEQAATDLPAPARRAARQRLLDHYLHSAHRAARLLNPHRDPLPLDPPGPGRGRVPLANAAGALSWFASTASTLRALIDLAGRDGFDAYVWPLAWTLTDYFERRGHWHHWVTTQEAALAAVRRLGDRPAQARAHRGLARAFGRLGRHADALHHLRQAVALHRALGDPGGEGHAHLNLAWLVGQNGDAAAALAHGWDALRLFRAAGHVPGQANALNSIGFSHAQLGDHRRAVDSCRQALPLLQDIGARGGEATTWDSLGFIHHERGHYAEAVACYRKALTIYQEVGDHHGETETLTRLGDTHRSAGNVGAARASWQLGLDLLAHLGRSDAPELRAKLAAVNGQATSPVNGQATSPGNGPATSPGNGPAAANPVGGQATSPSR